MLLLYDMEMFADDFLSDEVLDALVRVTSHHQPRGACYVSRAGKIEDVRVGDDTPSIWKRCALCATSTASAACAASIRIRRNGLSVGR
jgi:hypothetical protein